MNFNINYFEGFNTNFDSPSEPTELLADALLSTGLTSPEVTLTSPSASSLTFNLLPLLGNFRFENI